MASKKFFFLDRGAVRRSGTFATRCHEKTMAPFGKSA
jgi:hypothetical protein